MELLFVVLGGAILGAAARYALPHRSEHGSVLIPTVGALAAAVVWVGLTWLGWKWDGGWIWVASLVIAGLVAAAVDIVVGRTRVHADTEMLQRLTKRGATA
ncbi:hypothetical protein E6C70_01740 [Glaciibacter flavus]|uniref:GlsB/YeaQ/YmgE family stress response membrane protein n=1 Tax=Orlajensenia flava TaxID=2565934 RepID=A0A4S4G0J8_9MICO|nr:hypothetical protein [Glaciibacter flavus]THG36278.1 hypothetical protein E6C70_01740 [Glaciibacter flavus]